MPELIVRGARGTIPACGKEFVRYGGDTTCFSAQTKMGLLIVDAGTGIARLAREISQRSDLPPITILFTHFHLDHVIGLPCFDPVYNKDADISLMGDPRRASNWKDTLNNLMAKPYWPVGLGECAAALKLVDLPVADGGVECHGIRVSWFQAPHPQQCLSYRLDMPGNSVVIATDVEYSLKAVRLDFVNFCANADFFVCDAHYTPEEYPAHRGWGHSAWDVCAFVATEAGARNLVLTHHAPTRTDDEIDRIVEAARGKFPNTLAARENMGLAPEEKSCVSPSD